MHEKLLDYKKIVSEKWSNFDKGLKTRIIIIAIGLIAIMGMIIYLSAKPNWVVLKSKSDEATIGQMQQMFNDAGIKNRVTERATSIEVLEKDLNSAKILIAESDLIDQEDFKWDDVTSQIGIGMTENDKNKIYQNGDQKEIEQLIKEFKNVKNATVKLAIPENTSVFENNKNKVKAAVTLETTAGFTMDNAVTIAKLVETSVPGLEAENITISDQEGELLYSGNETSGLTMSTKEEIEKNKYDEIEGKIQDTLSPLFYEVKIISNIKFDWDKRTETNTTYKPPVDDATVGVPKTQIEQTENVVNGTAGQEPGIESNDQNPTNYAMDNGNTGTYDKSDKQTEYLYNSTEEVKEIAVGTIIPEQSSISVVVYKEKIYDEATLKKNKTLNKELTWEQFKEQNSYETPIEIDENLLETIKVGTGIENVTLVGYEKPVFIDKVAEPIAIEQIIVLIILVILIALLAFALIKKSQPDEIEEIEPEISIEDLIATNKREDEEVADKLSGINETESEFKVKIEQFIDENPEAAAQLLRNWLNDEWE
ncbi:MAG: flagellar M-ring protein FliF [Eubacteriales bacterium]|nr:flagellar M-ring protein FliF [Eubacteriales bacterium]